MDSLIELIGETEHHDWSQEHEYQQPLIECRTSSWAEPFIEVVSEDTTEHNPSEFVASVNSSVIFLIEVWLVFEEESGSEEEVEPASSEEDDAEEAVHGGVGVGIEVGEAGETEASQATQHEGAVVFIGGSDTVESLVYGTNLALETDKSEEGSRNAPYSVDERLSNNVTDGWQLRDGLIPVALLRIEPAFPV